MESKDPYRVTEYPDLPEVGPGNQLAFPATTVNMSFESPHATRATDLIPTHQARSFFCTVANLRGGVFAHSNLWPLARIGLRDQKRRAGPGDRSQRWPGPVFSRRSYHALGNCRARNDTRGS